MSSSRIVPGNPLALYQEFFLTFWRKLRVSKLKATAPKGGTTSTLTTTLTQ